ncbi:MAG TPA: DUF2461 family protein, partial [Cryptosporangiaceae bacterium]|nr:DUF2461 family protein [Cryptosporangiaceae bacterium]
MDDGRTGGALVALLATLAEEGWEIAGERLKRVPKPWDDTHPRADLLRHKALIASRADLPSAWLHTAVVKDRVAAAWRQLIPL